MSEAPEANICIIIITLNSDQHMLRVLKPLAPSERVFISDGGSKDQTLQRAAQAGHVLIVGAPGRGHQLARAANIALKYDTISAFLFLHADCQLPENWRTLCENHLEYFPGQAGYFRLRFDTPRWQARVVESLAGLRARVLGLPYGDQGLLISKELYLALGGFRPMALFEDVDIVRRLGRARLRCLPASLLTSADKYERRGYFRQSVRNVCLLVRYFFGGDVQRLARHYKDRSAS